MSVLANKKILLGISGGIAAYKSAILARRLIDEGAEVRVVMTAGAQAFIQPLTFQALTGNPVHVDLLDPAAEAAMGHIELARWAHYIVIAPASANTLAQLASGLASDLLSTLCLATDSPLFVAPAMNRLMWAHPATRANCELLTSRGVKFFGPGDGAQACGETGSGRMLEPEEIRDALINAVAHSDDQNPLYSDQLEGKRVLVTAGPTREAIDPVRYISNRSSGKMGFAIAEAAQAMGAIVTLVAGPVSLETSSAIKRVDVVSASDMLDAVLARTDEADVFISVAAVSDYRIDQIMNQKIKKENDEMQLSLVRNPDILKTVAALAHRPFCVGFAAETQDVETHARGKLERKKLDMIAANHVAQEGNAVFGTDTNALDVYWPVTGAEPSVSHVHIASASKRSVAASLLELVAEQLALKHNAP